MFKLFIYSKHFHLKINFYEICLPSKFYLYYATSILCFYTYTIKGIGGLNTFSQFSLILYNFYQATRCLLQIVKIQNKFLAIAGQSWRQQ